MECEKCPYALEAGACSGGNGTCQGKRHVLPPGTLLHARYLVGRVLGEGGFGITYLGFDRTFRSSVAIKEYFPPDRAFRDNEKTLEISGFTGGSGQLFESGKERFLREARVMARVMRTPNIVAVRDYFEENNTAYIVMDYIDGVTFRELVEQKGGKMEAGELFALLRPLFPALSHMHSEGMIHRDINPENLMLSGGTVCLLDFGCARENAEGDATMTVTLRHGYAPIEQYQPSGDGQGPWTDVYALAATIYYCLTGVTPVQAMDRLLEDTIVPPNKLGAGLTEGQERAILRALKVLPKRRTRTVEELYNELYKDVDRKPKKRRALLIAAGVAAAACLISAVPFFLRPGDAAKEPTNPVDADPFSRAAPARDLEEFMTLMNDDLVPAIVVPKDVFILIPRYCGPVHLEKPLLVEDGAGFVCQPCMWTTSELWVEPGGSLTQSYLTVEGGKLVLEGYFWGSAAAISGGTLDIRPGASPNFETLWIERPENLVDPQGLAPTNIFTFGIADEFDSFSDALRVSTYEELKNAAQEGTPVIVASPITLEDDLLFTSPIEVLAGASIHTDGFRLKCQSTVVVFGEIRGPLELGDNGLLYNMGTVVLDASRDPAYDTTIMNLGQLTLTAGRLDSTLLINLGVLTVDTSSGAPFVLRYGNVYTYGSMVLTPGSALDLRGMASLMADGVLTVGDGAVIDSTGYVEFRGNVNLNGDVQNRGLVCLKCIEIKSFGGHIVGGLVNVDEPSGFERYEVLDASCKVLKFRRTDYETVKVYTAEELLAELERDSKTPIAVYGDIEVGDLVVRRDLYLVTGTLRAGDVTVVGALINNSVNLSDPRPVLEARSLTILEGGSLQNDGGTVRLQGSLRLDGSSMILYGSMELNGGILLEGGALLQNSGTINGCGSITLRDGSVFFDNIYVTPGPDTVLDLDGGQYISPSTQEG